MITTPEEFAEALNTAFKLAGHPDITFEVMKGKKYNRVIDTTRGNRSAYCFIDNEGNIYKTASWAAPAKGVRATLATLPSDFAASIAASGYATTYWLYR